MMIRADHVSALCISVLQPVAECFVCFAAKPAAAHAATELQPLAGQPASE